MDTVEFNATTSASVDLAIAGAQSVGPNDGADTFANVENLNDFSGPATFFGTNGPNVFQTGASGDVLDGRGGADDLSSGDGNDSLTVRDGGPDTADCGPGTDTVVADAPGVDTLTNCEKVIFPKTDAGGGGGGGGGAGGGGQNPDRTPPSFTGRPKADPSRFAVDPRGRKETAVKAAVKKGTMFRFALSEAGTVTFVIQRQSRGRRVRGRCVKKTRANARSRGCRLFRRVGAFRAPAVAGANRKRFSGRIGKATLRPATYRVLLTAVDAAGNRSRTATIAFTVLGNSKRR